ncbi:MAG: hypothetical protein HY457_03300 [Parcubacteria group bacterium]|nr:hypothetical protein [Parcubacteria group bacterium]
MGAKRAGLIDCLPDERGRRRSYRERADDMLNEVPQSGLFDTGVHCKIMQYGRGDGLRGGVCNGIIIEHVRVHNPNPPALRIIGPGSRAQLVAESQFYCSDCGVSYHHVPGYDPAKRRTLVKKREVKK